MDRTSGGLPLKWKILLWVLPIAVGCGAMMMGRYAVSPMEWGASLWRQLTGGERTSADIVLWGMRLPRVLLAMLVGAGLSVSGCVFQGLFANPLATPDTLGVASGASFGAALGILLGFGSLGIQGSALLFGMIAVGLTVLGGKSKRGGMSTMVLSGIMIGSLFSALVSFTKYIADTDNQLPAITYWLMGSLQGAGYQGLALGAPPMLLCLLVLFLLRWRLNLLPLSEDEMRAAGVRVKLLRGVAVVCATLLTASGVSLCGQVGWVGLLVPHICRMKFGNNQLAVLPASISLGAVFLTVVDTLARSVSASELPISILSAFIGAPFFLYLMRRSGGWQ